MTEKIQMVCRRCGSADVRADAYADWNAEEQRWELTTTFDKGSACEVCEGECSIEEVPLDQWQLLLTETQIINNPAGMPVEISVEQLGDDEDRWVAIVSEEDVGQLFRGAIIHGFAEDAKDAARRWVLHGSETGSF